VETNEDVARHYEELKAQGVELEGLVRVQAQIRPNADVVYSVRFTRSEMDRIGESAKASKMKVSAFIRQAALAVVDGELDLREASKAKALKEVREHAQALAEAASRLI
jgi:hypothetical protein